MAENYSPNCMNAVVDYFKTNKFKFEEDLSRGLIKAGFNLQNCMIASIKMFFDVQKDGVEIYGISPLNVKEDLRLTAANYLSRANYGLRRGNFEIDMSDGEVRYKCWLECPDITPTYKMIDISIDTQLAMFTRYGDGLMKVMMGVKTAEEAIKEIEG